MYVCMYVCIYVLKHVCIFSRYLGVYLLRISATACVRKMVTPASVQKHLYIRAKGAWTLVS